MKANMTEAVRERKIVSVLVPLPVDQAYSYEVPPSMEVEIGCFVRVPVMGRQVCGVVVEVGEQTVKNGQSAASCIERLDKI
ncbi:hypothetical protein LNM86_10985 [Bartonella machadoae]|nr:hypothetical protein [Bartonella machadoae]UNE54060.1 hypothetical protein LNM86_10985 [Bartonella machadoae]